MALLQISRLSVKENQAAILKNVSFTQQQFEKLAIAGETGSGKSTLMKTIAGLMQPLSGGVYLEGDKIDGPEDQLVAGHPAIGYLSQHFELPKFLKVAQVLTYANTLSKREALKIYRLCKINALLERKTSQLSGGERQRIALARLLTSNPKLLLLDEPFSNLDHAHKSLLKNVIEDIGKALSITFILVSHDAADTLSWADRILILKKGKIIQQGKPQIVFSQPVNVYAAGLFGKYSLIDPAVIGSEKITRTGKTAIAGKRKIFLRPISLDVISDKQSDKEGTIIDITYYGSHYEITFAYRGEILLGQSASANFSIGEKISFEWDREAFWYI